MIQSFTDALEIEILPHTNGLRLHVADVYLSEMKKCVPITSVTAYRLMKPFLHVLVSVTDVPMITRVSNEIFSPLARMDKDQVGTDSENESSEEENEATSSKKIPFPTLDVSLIQHAMYKLAVSENTPDKNRNTCYTLYMAFFSKTGEDSSHHVGDMESLVKIALESGEEMEVIVVPEKKKRKSEKKKSSKPVDADAMEVDSVVITTSLDKSNEPKNRKERRKMMADKKKEELAKNGEETSSTVEEPVIVTEPVAEVVVAKAAAVVSLPETTSEPQEEQPRKKKKADKKKTPKTNSTTSIATTAVEPAAVMKNTTSPTGLPRCSICGGFGKGFLVKGKTACRHCTRTTATVSASGNKKVSFGRNQNLPHAESVKRLKASHNTPSSPASIPSSVLKKTSVVKRKRVKKSKKVVK